MDVSKAIRTKHAVRSFEDKALPEEAVRAILDSGRLAQSAKNMQPWQFIAVQDKKGLEAFSKHGHHATHIAGAALAVGILTFPPERRFSILFDAGQAAAYMQLAAWEFGIGSCLATIYHPEKAREQFGFPEEWHIRIAIAFGYPIVGEAQPRPSRRKGRNTFDDVVHWEKW